MAPRRIWVVIEAELAEVDRSVRTDEVKDVIEELIENQSPDIGRTVLNLKVLGIGHTERSMKESYDLRRESQRQMDTAELRHRFAHAEETRRSAVEELLDERIERAAHDVIASTEFEGDTPSGDAQALVRQVLAGDVSADDAVERLKEQHDR